MSFHDDDFYGLNSKLNINSGIITAIIARDHNSGGVQDD